MVRLIVHGIIVFVMSLALGGVGVYLYSVFFPSVEAPVRKVTLSLNPKDSGLVSEVYDSNGVLMDQLSYFFGGDAERKQAVDLLVQAGIKAEIHDSRVMVESGKTALAMDVLSLVGLIPGVDNFTFTDITAPEGSLQYKVEQRLATQNLLGNMIATMAEGVAEARVYLGAENIIGDISFIKVIIKRRAGVNGLQKSDLDGIEDNILAMTGITDRSIIAIHDSETGKKY